LLTNRGKKITNSEIPYGQHNITEQDIQAVVDVLRSDFITQGSAVPLFEKAICDYTSAKFAVACNSGTSALHIACLALGLGEGDWLWTTPITFVASANCALYCGAKVDFVDIDPQSWNLSVSQLEIKLELAKQNSCLPKVLVAVHLCGLPCDMEEIDRLSKLYGFFVIEDACHAIGGKYQKEPIGNGRYSDITIFSFHPVKTITTAEGGVAVTNNLDFAEKMTLFRSHGISKNLDQMTQVPDGAWYYQQLELGYNYRLNDIQAALGISQLKRLDEIVEKREELAVNYDHLLQSLPIQLPYRTKDSQSGRHLYVVRVDEKIHSKVFEILRAEGIGVNLHYIPIYKQPYYQEMQKNMSIDQEFSEAEQYYKEAITLPLYPELKDRQQQYIVSVLAGVLNGKA